MSVSKRLRYEILRRDDYACRYCGTRAAETALTVDHVIPAALGGGDDPSNLVAACADCNAGKSASSPDAPFVDAVAADALRWARAMELAAKIQRSETQGRLTYIAAFDEAWAGWKYDDGSEITRPREWASYVGKLYDQRLELAILTALVDDVLPRRIPDGRMWMYFCGAVRKVMAERVEIAREMVEIDEQVGE